HRLGRELVAESRLIVESHGPLRVPRQRCCRMCFDRGAREATRRAGILAHAIIGAYAGSFVYSTSTKIPVVAVAPGAAVTGFLADCKHALRLYVRTPVASFIAIAILAIGMGFLTLFLSLYVNLLLRPHPGF